MNTPIHANHATLAYRPDIDGLRALAVLLVITFHIFPDIFPFGFIGVDIFFVISGYLITGIILKNINANTFTIKGFYKRRILRIFPSLSTVLITCLIAGYFFLYSNEFAALGKHICGGAFFINNILLWHESGYFDAASYAKPLLNLWSLGIEEQYYIFFPFLIIVFHKFKINYLLALFLFCILSFADNIYFYKLYPPVAFYSPLTRVWELLAGACLAIISFSPTPVPSRLYQKLSSLSEISNLKLLAPDIIKSITGTGLLVAALFFCRGGNNWPGWLALLPVGSACCFIAAGQANYINKYLLANPCAIFIGKISYSLYLWHWPFISFAYIIFGGIEHEPIHIKSSIIIMAFIASILTYYCIEMPFRFKFKTKRVMNFKVIVALVCVFASGIAGEIVYLNAGFPERPQFKTTQKIIDQLKIYDFKNLQAQDLLGKDADNLLYTLYDNNNQPRTIAIIGDSHAGSAFHGVAMIGREYGFNTLMLGQFLPAGEVIDSDYAKQTKLILDIIADSPDIEKVFIFTRGMIYFTQQHNPGERKDKNKNVTKAITPELFKNDLQMLVNKLNNMGKKVYIVGENPELNIDIRDIFQRGLNDVKIKADYPPTTLAETINRQAPYLALLKSIKGATFIDTVNPFCSTGICSILNKDGIPLYFDDDHLSEAGSEFQAREILKPYLLTR